MVNRQTMTRTILHLDQTFLRSDEHKFPQVNIYILLRFWWFDWFKYITWIFLFYGYNTFVAGQHVTSTPSFLLVSRKSWLTEGVKEIKFCGNEKIHYCGKVNFSMLKAMFFIQKNQIKLRKCKAQTNTTQYVDIPLIFVGTFQF